MMILGVNQHSHDAAISLVDGSNILFAAHAERYSKVKNDSLINSSILEEALSYGVPDKIAYYEKPTLKKIRYSLFGGNYTKYGNVNHRLLAGVQTVSHSHHYSHACAGYFTSPYENATIVVLDSIGEFDTSSIWIGEGRSVRCVSRSRYPFSFGLFYSAFTDLIGLKPNEEEYILMGMAGYGDPDKYTAKVNAYFPSIKQQTQNFHSGVKWDQQIDEPDKFDIAAAVQSVYKDRLTEYIKFAAVLTKNTKNLVFMGGCALNCSANTALKEIYSNVWIMPNPGDAGSSLGAALATTSLHVNWAGPYLGTNIKGNYPVNLLLNELKDSGIAAVANGRAEYGPRALGNRSVLADPRHLSIKDKVNQIKKRELFRPFAPVVIEERAHEFFDIDRPSPYMQYAVKCKRPDLIPACVHVDGTSRVQTVSKSQHPGLHSLLEKWSEYSGVPVLLNTSLNIKGQPLLNNEEDVVLWRSSNPLVKVYTDDK